MGHTSKKRTTDGSRLLVVARQQFNRETKRVMRVVLHAMWRRLSSFLHLLRTDSVSIWRVSLVQFGVGLCHGAMDRARVGGHAELNG